MPYASVAQPSVYIESHIEGFSEAFPLYEWANGISSFDKGEENFAFSRLEAGLKYKNITIALLTRMDGYVITGQDTAEAIYVTESDNPVPKDENYQVDLSMQQLSAKGIRVGYEGNILRNLRVAASVQLLNADTVTDGKLSGYINTYEDGYEGQLHLDYVYSEDFVWDRPDLLPQDAEGFAVDLSLHWAINDQHQVSLLWLDAVNKIYWQQMYYTTSKLSSNRISYDDEGKLDVRAAMTGFEGERDFSQSLPDKRYVLWQYQAHPDHQLEYRLFSIDSYFSHRLKYTPQILKGWFLSVDSEKTVGLGVKHRFVDFYFASDSIDLKKSHSLSLQLALNYSF